jgi:integrase
MSSIELTPQLIKSATCPAGKQKIDYYDSYCKGLLLEIRITGGKTYSLVYTDIRGKRRQVKVADERDVTLTQARKLADKMRTLIAMGEDPLEKKTQLKKIPTISAFINESYLPFIKTYKRSWDTDVSLIKNHIIPNFGKQYLDEVSKKDILQFISMHALTHKPGSVNRVIILMRYIFNLCIRWETPGISKNPTAGIPLLEENNKKERFLTADEANLLVEKLKESDNKMLQYIIPMLILTGARKNEVLKAKWQDFNLGQKVWRIPISKSGKARHVPISDGVHYLLENVPRFEDCEYVFPNPKTRLPYISIFCSWNTARSAAQLDDVRIHDLRHSFASFLVNSGRSLYEVQRILGHTQIKTTQRYAHLSQDSLLSAANEISKVVPILMPSRLVEIPLMQIA